MPNGTFTIEDLLDHGLAVVPEEHERIASAEASVGPDLAGIFRAAAGSAARTPALGALADAVIAASDPQETATAFINAKYAALGGAAGLLGPTSTAVSACPDGVGWYRHFRAGSIYWHPDLGAHEVHGPIRAKWAELGWERGFLGYPTSDQQIGRDPDARGAFNRFQGGAILWHPDVDATPVGVATVARAPLATAMTARALAPEPTGRSPFSRTEVEAGAIAGAGFVSTVDGGLVLGSSRGAHEVHGAIGAHYFALGGSGSFLGYPVTDETGTPDGVGRYNHFQAGSIYWTPSTWAQEVHGLIRQLWANQGWERNAALGYPISDELIPDRRIGHRHPEQRRKPFAALPADVVKLPAEAASVGFSPLVSNVPAEALTRSALAGRSSVSLARATGAEMSSATTAGRPIDRFGSVVGTRPDLGGIVSEPTSTPAPEPSPNRFGDFESGVLFWRRGSTAAQQLQPWVQSSDGESMHRSAAGVIAAMEPSLQQALGRLSGAALAGFAFSGTSSYSWDGAGVRNRRHRVTVSLMGSQRVDTTFGGSTSIPVPLALELQIEVLFQPVERAVTVCLADWSFADSAALDASPPLARQLHDLLDPLLFRQVDLIDLPDTDGGRPIAVLSVKTVSNGDVFVFVEPGPSPTLTG